MSLPFTPRSTEKSCRYKRMKSASLTAISSCLAWFLFPAFAAQRAEKLQKFTFKGVAPEGRQLTFAPTGELERSCLIKMEGRVKNPLGKDYMDYSPHKHAGIGPVYSDSIEGPWAKSKGQSGCRGNGHPGHPLGRGNAQVPPLMPPQELLHRNVD